MSKAIQESEEADFEVQDTFRDDGPEEPGEDQPLRALSHEGKEEDLEDFLTTHNLQPHSALFQRASAVLNHNGPPSSTPGLTQTEQEALSKETSHPWHQPRPLYLTIAVCSLAAIEQGMAQTGMNGANLYLPWPFGISANHRKGTIILGAINCSLYLAQGTLGAWMSWPLNALLGRRGAIFVATALCIVGNFGCGMSDTWEVLVVFRAVLGMGLGLNSATANVFAAEAAPAYVRGGLAVCWQMFTAFGIFLGFLANVSLVIRYSEMHMAWIWRLQLLAPVVPCMPLLMLVWLCPESAAWYIKKKNYPEAFRSLSRLRNTPLQAAMELYSTYLTRRRNDTGLQAPAGLTLIAKLRSLLTKFVSLVRVPRNRHALYASYTVMLSQQLSGINIIAFFSSTIFATSGSTSLTANWASVVFGLVNFLGAFPAIFTMDRYGRRWLLLYTLPFMALTMAAASASFSLPTQSLRFAVLAGCVYLFCALYSPGMGPVPCAYSAEVYPLSVREFGMSVAISTAALWAAVLSLTFPPLLKGIGEQRCFALYAFLNVVAWALCWTFVRETKGIELEEMDRVFESSPRVFVREAWKDGFVRWRRETGMGMGMGKGWREVRQEDDERG